MTLVSTLGQNKDNIFRLNDLQRQLSDLQIQLGTGKITQRFKGLQTDVIRSQRARADVGSLETYTNNITRADRRIKMMLHSVEEFQAQARNFSASLDLFVKEGAHQEGEIVYWDDPLTPEVDPVAVGMDSAEPSVDFSTLRDMADKMFDFMVELVNTQEGGRYLLSGAQTLTKPLVNTGLLTTASAALINDWKNGALGTEQVMSAIRSRDALEEPRAITDAIIGYAPEISAGNVKGVNVRVNDSAEFDYTLLGNAQGFRDVLVAMDFIRSGSLPPIVDEVDPDNPLAVITEGMPGNTVEEMQSNFFNVFQGLSQMISHSLDKIDEERFKLEQVRANLQEVKEDHVLSKQSLLDTIAEVEDADMNEVAVQISFMQVRLEASYRVTATLSDLNLVNFLR